MAMFSMMLTLGSSISYQSGSGSSSISAFYLMLIPRPIDFLTLSAKFLFSVGVPYLPPGPFFPEGDPLGDSLQTGMSPGKKLFVRSRYIFFYFFGG